MSRVEGHSKHRHVQGVKHVKRSWHSSHIAAGYHEQDFGSHSQPGHHLHGKHVGLHGDIYISHLEKGDTGPEFHIAFEGGHQVTVLDEFTVRYYLAQEGIQEHMNWAAQQNAHQEALEHDMNRTGLHSLIRDIRAGIEEGGEERIKQLEREYPDRL